MKWIMLFSSLTILPFTAPHIIALPWRTIALTSYLEVGFAVFFGTYCAYLLMTFAQQRLQPTQVAIYNYLQPVLASLVSVIMGLAVFGWQQAVAILLVFAGVWLVIYSRTPQSAQQTHHLHHAWH